MKGPAPRPFQLEIESAAFGQPQVKGRRSCLLSFLTLPLKTKLLDHGGDKNDRSGKQPVLFLWSFRKHQHVLHQCDQHRIQLEAAFGKKEWATVRVLGPEYVNRYPSDDKADEALFFLGSADLQDGRPSSALGQFNRLLKLFPRSNVLDRTLYGIGDAYLLMHDCANAKVAYDACEKRFTKDKIGAEAKAKLDQIGKSPPGMCAPN